MTPRINYVQDPPLHSFNVTKETRIQFNKVTELTGNGFIVVECLAIVPDSWAFYNER